jgi:hypothetical protein
MYQKTRVGNFHVTKFYAGLPSTSAVSRGARSTLKPLPVSEKPHLWILLRLLVFVSGYEVVK